MTLKELEKKIDNELVSHAGYAREATTPLRREIMALFKKYLDSLPRDMRRVGG